MNKFEKAIEEAIIDKGQNKKANERAYLEFIKANFIVPIEKESSEKEPEVLFVKEQDKYYLPAFTKMILFDDWVKEIKDEISLLKVSGVDLLKNIGKEVVVCVNIGDEFYKEFHPEEIEYMQKIVLKIFK